MNKRQKSYKQGLRAERKAALYLRAKGYRIIGERYKTPVGEIDLIAVKKDALVIIEVKARKDIGEALHAIPQRAQSRIEKAALHFLSSYPHYASYALRFDVIAFGAGLWPTHVQNAWHSQS